MYIDCLFVLILENHQTLGLLNNDSIEFISSIQSEKKLSPENEEVLKTAIAAVKA